MQKVRFKPHRLLEPQDPREMPAYGIPEAAHYLGLPAATLRSWVLGRSYPVAGGKKRRFKPLIALQDPSAPLLSFFNLAETHVLSALRRQHGVELRRIRPALDYLAEKYGSQHPLIDHKFETDGLALFIRELGKLVDVSARGQVVLREVMEAHLQRLEREGSGVVRLYPFTRPNDLRGPRLVFIDPRFSFGKPVLATTRIPTGIIAERYRGGDSIDDLADDYGCTRLEIEEALRWEIRLAA